MTTTSSSRDDRAGSTSDVIFLPDDGPDPRPGPPEPPPPTTLPGAIGKRWRELGGKEWGTPSFAPEPTGVGGTWVQFAHRDGSFSSIIWSSATGARVVNQRINQAYARVQRMRGPLGLPTSEELATHDGVGRFQTFQGGLVVWHPSIGAFEVHGAISATYLTAGGTRYGYPTTDEGGTPDGRGRFNHFRHVESGSDRSIYWTPTTGAHPVYGLIRDHWAKLRWERSALGYPTAPEADTHDRRGRYQVFEGGSMVWSPATGAHAVHAPMLARYGQLGGSAFGYPLNDPTSPPDGTGRYQHFRDLGANTERSIYWHPSTGTHEVYGLIRQRWAELGWERSFLGYPINAEHAWNDRPGGRRQGFQHGTILYTPADGAYADPMRWSKAFKGGGFRGHVDVVADSSGRIRLDGQTVADWPAKFSYVVQTMITSSTSQAVVLTHKGGLTAVTQDDHDALHDVLHHGFVAANFPAFSRGTLRVDHQHSNDVTKFLGDITDGLIKFTVGSLAITPGTGLLVLGAAELYSVLSGGGVAGGARIASGMLWMAGPNGIVFALAADGLARLASHEDTLGTHEYRVANAVFKGTLPPRESIVISDGVGAGGKPFTFPRWDGKIVVSLGDGARDPLHARHERCQGEGQLLIHELTHAWHYHNDPALMRYVGSAVFGGDAHPGEFPTGNWDRAFTQEQKSVIVDEWFNRNYDPNVPEAQDFGLGSAKALKDPSFVYIRDQIRTRRT